MALQWLNQIARRFLLGQHDCYIGLSRINRQESEISAGVAEQQAETAVYRKVTGKRANNKRRRTVPAW